MSNASDFVIEKGELKGYKGQGGDVVIPNGVTSIAKDTFSSCSSLVSVTIPGTVKSIGKGAFSKCSALEKAVILDGVESIGNWAFWDCKKLSEITIPDSVTSICGRAFSSCSSLKSVSLPSNIRKIDTVVFDGCVNLLSITIPDGVTEIGYEAFRGCRNLAEIVIPESVINIGDGAFGNCGALKSISLPANLHDINSGTFYYCNGLTEISVPAGVKKIGREAFYGCSGLTSVTIPESVTEIGDYAFAACRNLTCLTIPESVYVIGEDAFFGCSRLEQLSIPKKLKSLGKEPFGNALPESLADKLGSFYHALSDGGIKQYILSGKAKTTVWDKLSESLKAEIFLSRQGKALTGAYIDCIGEAGIEPMGEALLDKLKGELSAKECNAAVSFMTMFATKAPETLLTRLYQALKTQKNGKKALEAIESNAELKALLKNAEASGAAVPESRTDPFVSMMLDNKVSAKEAELNLKDYYSLDLNELPAINAKDGSIVPPAFAAWMMTMHEEQRPSGWSSGRGMPSVEAAYPPGLRPEAAAALEMIDDASLQKGLLNIADRFLDKYVNTKKKYLTFPICRYADEATMAEMTRRAPSWSTSVSGSSAPPLGEFRSAVCYSNTRAAMLFAERYKDLDRYARIHGTDADTIRDRYMSDVGLDAQGCKSYDLGNQTVVARLQKDMSFLIELADGKTAKTLPKKGADPEKYELAAADFSEMKKSVKKILKTRGSVLFDDFLSGRSRQSADWQTSYLGNPLLHEAASLLVWVQKDKTFTLSDSGPIDSSGKAYTLSDDFIKVAHPMEMEPDEVSAWQKYFTTGGLKQPFAQVWEPVIDPAKIKEDRYEGSVQPMYRFSGKDKHGIHSGNLHAYSEDIGFSLDDCKLSFEVSTGRIGFDAGGETYTLGKFSFKEYTRKVNHIVSLLDKWTVEDRIKKDDASIMDLMDGFTLAQITEFIAAAQEADAVNVLALLLDYKNKRFADFDPMDEFTLEW